MTKKIYTLGCCGLDCGLCPRFYTEGSSRCPGCCGENFEKKLSLENLNESLLKADKVIKEKSVGKEDLKGRAKILGEVLNRCASEENEELKLRKVKI